MDLFLIKKVISATVMPLNMTLILLLLSAILFKKYPTASFKYLTIALLLLTLSSIPIVSDKFMVSIEDNHEAFTRSDKPVDYIVVLGGWHQSNPALPTTSQLNINSLQRMVEVLRIYRLHPEARIITSGSAFNDTTSNAEKMKQSLIMLGVAAQKIITENFPKDTEEEAQLISPRIQGTNAVLVTNAAHMPRAMQYFQAQGVYPIAAPTGFWVKSHQPQKSWRYYWPDSKKLQQTSVAWYETLGRLVQWIKSIFS